jgi:hypothetical protein
LDELTEYSKGKLASGNLIEEYLESIIWLIKLGHIEWTNCISISNRPLKAYGIAIDSPPDGLSIVDVDNGVDPIGGFTETAHII